MGTNYYLIQEFPSGYKNKIHLGKKSGGWQFIIKATPHLIETFEDFKKAINTYPIRDEWNKPVDPNWMLDMVLSSENEQSHYLYCLKINRIDNLYTDSGFTFNKDNQGRW